MIAISNMDKPKEWCIDCPFSYEREDDFKQICDLLDRDVSDGIPNNCPLIEIVTCVECVYYRGDHNYCSNDYFAKENGFCSYGERRE